MKRSEVIRLLWWASLWLFAAGVFGLVVCSWTVGRVSTGFGGTGGTLLTAASITGFIAAMLSIDA